MLPRGVFYEPIQENGQWIDQEPTSRERRLANGDFSMQVIGFTDARQFPNSEGLVTPDIAYRYDPENILQGVKSQVPSILQSYLPAPTSATKAYKVEIELLRLNTLIKTGTLWTGTWGSYFSSIEIVARVRRADSTVALERHYRMELERKRSSPTGRAPAGDIDHSEMFYLVDRSLRKIAENMAWDIRSGDDARWKPEKTASAKTASAKASPDEVPAVSIAPAPLYLNQPAPDGSVTP